MAFEVSTCRGLWLVEFGAKRFIASIGSTVHVSASLHFTLNFLVDGIGHVNEYTTMHYFGNPRYTQSMIAYMILTKCFLNFQ